MDTAPKSTDATAKSLRIAERFSKQTATKVTAGGSPTGSNAAPAAGLPGRRSAADEQEVVRKRQRTEVKAATDAEVIDAKVTAERAAQLLQEQADLHVAEDQVRGQKDLRGRLQRQAIAALRQEYFDDPAHGVWIDYDGTAYRASLDKQTSATELQRQEAAQTLPGQAVPTVSARTVTIDIAGATRDTATITTQPTGEPGEVRQVHTETVAANADGAVIERTSGDALSATDAAGATTVQSSRVTLDAAGARTEQLEASSTVAANGDVQTGTTSTTTYGDDGAATTTYIERAGVAATAGAPAEYVTWNRAGSVAERYAYDADLAASDQEKLDEVAAQAKDDAAPTSRAYSRQLFQRLAAGDRVP
ncbi:MAG: hypothetical protein H7287_00265, partial [Thermoleophilia bacterium]|nr:hypothetical protein [Thermoleophilia bacterium]